MAKATDPRLWIRLTLDFADHPKIVRLSDRAFRTLTEMILWSKQGLTDGVLPRDFVHRRWGNPETQSVTQSDTDPVAELLTNDPEKPSLRVTENGDYLIHDYCEHQETREQVEARKRRNQANGALGGRPKKTESVTQSDTESGGPVGYPEQKQTLDVRRSSSKEEEPRRSDIDEILDLLDEAITASGFDKPRRTKGNWDAARLLIDRDGRNMNEIRAAIDYLPRDEFWRTNIRSMSKFREKWDQLKGSAQRNRPSSGGYRNQNQIIQDMQVRAHQRDQQAALEQSDLARFIEGSKTA